MIFKEIGEKIQRAREDRGLSQEQLANLIGCSQSALSNYEKGKRRLYLTQLESLARVLDMPIEYFMESRPEDDQVPQENSSESDILRLMNEIYSLTPEERYRVLDYIAYIRWQRAKEVHNHGKPGTDQRTKKARRKNP
ncbi:MAG: helix-turn-helix domain-containing protein [Candidatus Saccharibacteria bacterium]